MSEWISVEDSLPEEAGLYNVVLDSGIVSARTFNEGVFWGGMRPIGQSVTHWMPLPEPPKE